MFFPLSLSLQCLEYILPYIAYLSDPRQHEYFFLPFLYKKKKFPVYIFLKENPHLRLSLK